jgi:hypothetical protein
MKKLLLAASILTTLTAHAQQRPFHIKDSYSFDKSGDFKSHTAKAATGTVNISSKEFIVSEGLKQPEIYLVIKDNGTEPNDEMQTTHSYTVAALTKTGTYKVIECVELLDRTRVITDIEFKKSKRLFISYQLK